MNKAGKISTMAREFYLANGGDAELLPPTLRARTSDPETSQAALDGISHKAYQVLEELKSHGGIGAQASLIAYYLKWNRDSVTPVLPQLERRGLVKRSGFKRKYDGVYQTVWVHEDYEYQTTNHDKPMAPVKRKASRHVLEGLLIEFKLCLEADYVSPNTKEYLLKEIKEVLNNE